MLISKIISGGQTGVDRGAIEAALELGFPYRAERDRPYWWSRSGGAVMAMQQKDNAIRRAKCR